MKRLFIFLSLVILTSYGLANNQLDSVRLNYDHQLELNQTHKFNDNQIRSFVYYWFGLHDKHLPIDKSMVLLSNTNLLMVYPEIMVHNKADYKKWYDGVGENIKSNLHHVKSLNIKMLDNHRYQIDLVVNWQAIDKNNKFINIDATQTWILMDGSSDAHPLIEQYRVINFKPVT